MEAGKELRKRSIAPAGHYAYVVSVSDIYHIGTNFPLDFDIGLIEKLGRFIQKFEGDKVFLDVFEGRDGYPVPLDGLYFRPDFDVLVDLTEILDFFRLPSHRRPDEQSIEKFKKTVIRFWWD